MDTAMGSRESAATSLNAKDEAALVDSFFLPGGILDPDQEEEKEQEKLDNTLNVVYHHMPSVPTANTSYQWSDAPPMTQPSMCYVSEPLHETGEEIAEPNSFWSTAVSGKNPYEHTAPVFSSTPEPWMLIPALEESIHKAKQLELEPQDILQDTALFPYKHSFTSQDSSQKSDLAANLATRIAASQPHPTQPVHTLEVGAPLLGPLGTVTTTSHQQKQKPPPSAQEVEDVRKMVLVLSSSLQNLGGSSDNPLPEHLMRPDSPPKIIRRRSSISSQRVNNSIRLELPQDPHKSRPDEDDDLIDQQSTTSSLSSGSAKRDDGHQSYSPLPLSVNYDPPEMSFLAVATAGLPKQPFLDEDCCYSPSSDHHDLSQPQRLFSSACGVPPPSGYQHLLVPQRLEFTKEDEDENEEDEPKPVALQSPSPSSLLLSLSVSSPLSPQECERRVQQLLSHEKGEEGEPLVPQEDISWHQVLPKGSSTEQPQDPSSSTHPVTSIKDLAASLNSTKSLRRRMKPTLTTTFDPQHAVEIAQATSFSKKKRAARKQKSSQKKATTAPVAPPQRQQDYLYSPVASMPSSMQQRELQDPPRRVATAASAVKKAAPTTRPIKTDTAFAITPTIEAVLDFFDNCIEFIRRCVQFTVTLLSCMIQEAAKEAIERRSIAGCYATIFFTPPMSTLIMDRLVWLPDFFPGITMGLALAVICRSMEKDQYLIEAAAISPIPLEAPGEDTGVNRTSSATKKSCHITSKNQPPESLTGALSQREHRLQELRSMEAQLCLRLLKKLRWNLPSLVFLIAVADCTSENECVPALRLVAAFGLSSLQTFNLFSPLAWMSASLQVLFALSMRNSNTYIERWFGVEILICSLGLSTLRFLRLSARRKHV
jgi:hypothetical protein